MTRIFALLRYYFQVLYIKWSAKLFEIDGVREFMLIFYFFNAFVILKSLIN